MNIHDAAKIAYAGRPAILQRLQWMEMMDHCGEYIQSLPQLVRRNDYLVQAAWWIFYAIVHNHDGAIEKAKSYLELTPKEQDDPGTR